MKTITINTQTFNEIKNSGSGVPRNLGGYTLESDNNGNPLSRNIVTVGSSYYIKCNGVDEKIKITVTQNCPIAFKIINN